ncbi:TolC family protein [Mangrovimonas aestuarii]|uniref:TolC family protein n=1 Tax=Mangrovimonas aestuarii TaxID=3018443 RepID=UPI00237934CC|nr:TolC family protein [Mangrovimonas aestuarii]
MKRSYLTLQNIVLGVFILSNSICAQELDGLIEEALINNPEVQMFEMQYQRASEKVNEVNAIGNTDLGVGYFISEPETRTGPQRFKVSVKQMVPWFGTITARENYVSSLIDSKYQDIAIVKRKLMASVSQSYYNLYTIKAKQGILTENIALLQSYEQLALTSLEVGEASAVDILQLQMRQNDLEQLKKILDQDFLAEQTALNKFLNRDKDIVVQLVDSLFIPETDDLNKKYDLELHPELIKYDKLYESVIQSELLNQKESSPMMGFGLDYINVQKRTDMDVVDNGKDIVMPMVSISIPIFNSKYKSTSKQNKLLQEEITYQKLDRFNKLEIALEKALKSREASRISYNTQVINLEEAKHAEILLTKSYETGTVDFNDILDIQELQLKFQMEQVEALKRYYIQNTIINYLSQ